jgi:NAD(P)-dependent dehydrogenase (short-subunit alcohol dehydrogenase family)
MDKTCFEAAVVVVLGGGRGLGEAYCRALGREGARVVVVGRGNNVDLVAEEVRQAGGVAISCVAGLDEPDVWIARTLEIFGRVDALIVNSGNTCDRPFARMEQADWDDVIQVHVGGAYANVRAVWPLMAAQENGQILLTTSGSAVYGNYGQANYAAAKGAVLGLMRSLAVEGARLNIRVNAISPIAFTAMSEKVLGDAAAEKLKPEYVAPFALALVHPGSRVSGEVVEVGGKWAATLRLERSAGFRSEICDVADIIAHWSDLASFETASPNSATIEGSLSAALGAPATLTRNPPA